MNFSLYKQMMKVNLKGMMNYASGTGFYMLLMVWVYPSIAETAKPLNNLLKAMPQGMTKAFNMQNGFGSFETYISGEFYGLLFTVICAIFCVMIPVKLMAKLVDQGSMAYLLATPTTRSKVAFTQAMVFLTGLILITAITTVVGFIGYNIFIEDEKLNTARFIQLNIGAFALFFAIGGLSFLVSSLTNDEKKALGLCGMITFGFFSLDILSKISDKIEWLKNITLFTLYNPGEIVSGKGDLMLNVSILLAIGIAALAISVIAFRKRDLPL
jgi:ABC-2 type transport system permease protein